MLEMNIPNEYSQPPHWYPVKTQLFTIASRTAYIPVFLSLNSFPFLQNSSPLLPRKWPKYPNFLSYVLGDKYTDISCWRSANRGSSHTSQKPGRELFASSSSRTAPESGPFSALKCQNLVAENLIEGISLDKTTCPWPSGLCDNGALAHESPVSK